MSQCLLNEKAGIIRVPQARLGGCCITSIPLRLSPRVRLSRGLCSSGAEFCEHPSGVDGGGQPNPCCSGAPGLLRTLQLHGDPDGML